MRGQITATFSRRMQVRLDDGTTVDARIKGKRLKPVCGDYVDLAPIAGEDDWLISAIEERRNVLSRPNRRGREEALAANLDRLIVVTAAEPAPDWFVVDRYLCAAELMRTDAVVVFNKLDLLSDTPSRSDVERVLEDYRSMAYPSIQLSAATGVGMSELTAAIAAGTSILVGQSGVGKSSIVNRILGTAAQRTSDLSRKFVEGKHTTVNSVMLDIESGGRLIDSPGVRDYAPALAPGDRVAEGFREIRHYGESCRFANCRHVEEPGCEVRRAAKDGRISDRRYRSYRRMLNIAGQRR